MYKNSKHIFIQKQSTLIESIKMNKNIPEIIRASTPLILAGVGCVIGGMVIVNPQLSDARWSSRIGLAGTAITGAAGLAQSNSRDNDSSNTEAVNNLRKKEA